MTDLDKLIAAVEAGDEAALFAALRAIASAARDRGEYWPAHDATKAFSGYLDATLRLHEALLPGWIWGRQVNGAVFVAMRPHTIRVQTGAHMPPARAWLLAILRALKAKGEA